MREKLNSDPIVQAALIGVLALVAGLLLLMRMGGSSEPEVTDPAAPAPAASADPANSKDVPVTPDPATGSAIPSGVDAAGLFKPGPGLPRAVVNAYEADKAVVLVILQGDGIDDRGLERRLHRIQQRSDAAVFVVKGADVARYSRVTQGVDLNRTPALVIIVPKQVSDGPIPTASISYGFRGINSVDQALDDALYKGPENLPYYPK
jgi:hypothetical protein